MFSREKIVHIFWQNINLQDFLLSGFRLIWKGKGKAHHYSNSPVYLIIRVFSNNIASLGFVSIFFFLVRSLAKRYKWRRTATTEISDFLGISYWIGHKMYGSCTICEIKVEMELYYVLKLPPIVLLGTKHWASEWNEIIDVLPSYIILRCINWFHVIFCCHLFLFVFLFVFQTPLYSLMIMLPVFKEYIGQTHVATRNQNISTPLNEARHEMKRYTRFSAVVLLRRE